MTTGASDGSGQTRVRRHVVWPLRVSLAFIWLFTGLVCIGGTEAGTQFVERVGIHGELGTWIIRLTSGFEILLGIAILLGRWPRLVAIVQIVLVAGFTVIISVYLPENWLHPFGPVSKNVVLIAAAYALGRLSEDSGGRFNRG